MRDAFVNRGVIGTLLLCQFCICSDLVPWFDGLASADERPRPAADAVVTASQRGANDGNNLDASIRRLISTVDPERISKHVFYLAKDPLPYRKLNLTLPGHQKNTLYEADDYLAGKLEACGYCVEREGVQVQAFRRDTSKPKHAQYSPPKSEDP